MIDSELLAVLACPCCKGRLEPTPPGDEAAGLLCSACALVFPSEGGIQVLLQEEGIALDEWRAGKRKNKTLK